MASTTSDLRALPCLPPEIYDLIFKQSSKATLKSSALVCRTWNSLTSRYLLLSVVIRTVERMKDLEKSPRAHSFVRSLSVDVPAGGARWTARDLANLLLLLSNLEKLSLNLNMGSPGPLASYRIFASQLSLPKLTHLELSSDKYDGNQRANQQILQATPNICSLTVKTTEVPPTSYDTAAPHAPGRLHPVNLPLLTHLGMRGELVAMNFLENQILDDATLDSITSLSISSCRFRYLTPPPIFHRLRDQIKSVQIHGLGLSEINITGLKVAEEVILIGCPWPDGPLPSSVSTLILQETDKSTEWMEYLQEYTWGRMIPDHVKTLELQDWSLGTASRAILGRALFTWLATRLRRSIMANGVTYYPRIIQVESSSSESESE